VRWRSSPPRLTQPGLCSPETEPPSRAVSANSSPAVSSAPGLRAGALDELVRAYLGYPHHTGHGLGTSWHEEPRMVPGGTVRESGMVVALEL
jgi:Xaa-Pro aminopeptidase